MKVNNIHALLLKQNFSSCFYEYFLGYVNGSNTDQKVKTVENFIKRNTALFAFTTIQETRKFTIDLKTLLGDEDFKTSWKDFDSDLRDHPNNSISCIGLAMHQVNN